jgi:hypothetical protein
MPVLSRVQENEIFEAIRTRGMDPADFDWTIRRTSGDEYRRITYVPTQAHLEFSSYQGGGFWLSWAPILPSGRRYGPADTWNNARYMMAAWLDVVKQDHEAPDLWGALKAQRAITGETAQAEASKPFSPTELKLLEAGLDDIERYVITTQPLDPDGREHVKGRFRYLADAARSGARKIDWLNIFVGQMVSLVTEGVLQTSFYRPLMAHAAAALQSVFQFGLKLLQSSGN